MAGGGQSSVIYNFYGQKREETAGCAGSRTRAEGGKVMRNVEIFNDF